MGGSNSRTFFQVGDAGTAMGEDQQGVEGSIGGSTSTRPPKKYHPCIYPDCDYVPQSEEELEQHARTHKGMTVQSTSYGEYEFLNNDTWYAVIKLNRF